MHRYGAIILAGGRSSRMRADKASLVINGQTLLERSIRTVFPLVSEIVVMLSAKQDLPPMDDALRKQIQIGRDSKPEQGPLQGIADAAPKLSPHSASIYILTCDLPFLDSQWLNSMKEIQQTPELIVCAKYDGVPNPLLALYPLKKLIRAQGYLDAGERSCLVLIRDEKIATLSAPKEKPLVCTDINTPSEFEKAIRNLSA